MLNSCSESDEGIDEMSGEHVTVIATGGGGDSSPEMMQTTSPTSTTSTVTSNDNNRVNIIRINSEENFESFGDNDIDVDDESSSPREENDEDDQRNFAAGIGGSRHSWMRTSLRKSSPG